MDKIMTRFGEVEYDPDNLLTFDVGPVGFEALRRFIVMPNRKEGPLFWIQAVDDPEVAFVLTDPTNFFVDYRVEPETQERRRLGLSEEGTCYNLSVVTVREDKTITLNLQAPILYNPENNRALQVILEGSDLPTKAELPKVKPQHDEAPIQQEARAAK